MKSSIIRAIVVLGLMASFSAINAYAQAPGRIKFEAPFEFTVGGKTLPAGKYSVQRIRFDASDVLLISDKDNHGVVNFSVIKKEYRDEADTCKLIFHRYGDKRFLKQIQYNYGNLGYEV